jgi:hypothetical protein
MTERSVECAMTTAEDLALSISLPELVRDMV